MKKLLLLFLLILAFSLSYSEPSKIVLGNGLKIAHLPDTERKLTTTTIVIKINPESDTRYASGISRLAAFCLLTQTNNMSQAAFQRELESVGGGARVIWDTDYIAVSITTQPNNFRKGVTLLANALRNPTFSQDDVNRAIKSANSELDKSLSSLDGILLASACAQLYVGNRYAMPYGLKVKESSPELLALFIKDHFSPDNIAISVWGNVSGSEVSDIFEKVFGSLEETGRLLPEKSHRIITIKKPAEQTIKAKTRTVTVSLSYRMPGLNSPEYPKARLLASLIGSGKCSRLFQRVREQLGIGYVVNADYLAKLASGILTLYVRYEPGNDQMTPQALSDEMANIVDGVLTNPPDKEEFETIKQLTWGNAVISNQSASFGMYTALSELSGAGYEREIKMPELIAELKWDDCVPAAKTWLNHPVKIILMPERNPRY